MEVFVCQRNIDRFRNLLAVVTGEMQRREIRRLLALEEIKLRQLILKDTREARSPRSEK